MTKVTGEMLERVETLIPIYENAADWAGRTYPALAPSEHHKSAAALRSVAACVRRVIEPGEEEINNLKLILQEGRNWPSVELARAVLAAISEGNED